jgi:hypothetical protein
MVLSKLTTDQKVDRLIKFLETIYGPDLLDEEVPPVVKPAEGKVKEPSGWGANKDPATWTITNMRNFPALFKVVDDKGVNVATDFSSQRTAQAYIDYNKSIYKEPDPEPEPEPEPEPQPGGGGGAEGESVTKDGVKVPVKIKGSWSYQVKEDWRDGGARFNMPGAGTSLVTVGCFTATQDKGDEISPKVLMGRHTGNAGSPESYMGCGYDGGIRVGGGKPRMRAECPHPKYTSALKDPIVAESALSMVGKWRLYMVIVKQEDKGVRIQMFQDQGDCETKPANQWKKIYEYFDTGQIAKIKESGMDLKFFPIKNLDHTKGTAQTVWRCDDTPGLKQKWMAVASL